MVDLGSEMPDGPVCDAAVYVVDYAHTNGWKARRELAAADVRRAREDALSGGLCNTMGMRARNGVLEGYVCPDAVTQHISLAQ